MSSFGPSETETVTEVWGRVMDLFQEGTAFQRMSRSQQGDDTGEKHTRQKEQLMQDPGPVEELMEFSNLQVFWCNCSRH